MPRRTVVVDPNFGKRLKELREERRLSLRRLGQRVHCSHGFLWDLESGVKRPSVSIAALLDAALDAGGGLSGMVHAVSADSAGPNATGLPQVDSLPAGLEFAPDWRHGVDIAADLWRTDVQRRNIVQAPGFSAAAFLAPAMRWLTAPLNECPRGEGERLVGEPDVEMVRRITGVYRTLDNQYGGGHVRDSVVRFLDGEVATLLRGRYDAQTGVALLSAAAEATQLAGWATYDVGLHGLVFRTMKIINVSRSDLTLCA